MSNGFYTETADCAAGVEWRRWIYDWLEGNSLVSSKFVECCYDSAIRPSRPVALESVVNFDEPICSGHKDLPLYWVRRLDG